MTALTAIAPTGTPAHMRLYRLIRDGVVDAEMVVTRETGGRVYDLTDTELLVAVTVLALRDLPEVAHAVAECIRQRPVQPGEWLVVTADGEVRRYEHLCLDDLAPFDAARVVRLTPAVTARDGVGAVVVSCPEAPVHPAPPGPPAGASTP